MAIIDDRGREILSGEPVAHKVGRKVESHEDMMRRLIREELSRQAVDDGNESFEEANDFDVGEDYDPSSPYEMSIEQEFGPIGEPEDAPLPSPTPDSSDVPVAPSEAPEEPQS